MPVTTEQQAKTAFYGLQGYANTAGGHTTVDVSALGLPEERPSVKQDQIRKQSVPATPPPELVPDTLDTSAPDYWPTYWLTDDQGNSLRGSILGRRSGAVSRYVEAPLSAALPLRRLLPFPPLLSLPLP